MQVRLKCFAWAREVTGQDEIEIICPEDATVGDLREKLAEKYRFLRSGWSRSPYR